jgi:tetratricopeptide (TPR) repeat protein
MRCFCLRSCMFLAAAVILSAARFAVAQDMGSPSGEIRVVDSKDAHTGNRDAADPDSATLERPTGRTPTPSRYAPRANSRVAPTSNATPPNQRSKAAPPDEAINPIVDPQEGPPVAIEATSFKGVIPGTSTKEDVAQAWGAPKKSATPHGSLVQLYSVEPFKRVEVNYADGKVSSIVIRLDRPFPVDMVVKHLDLSAIRPAPVFNDVGEVLGRAYPERGVLFAFEPADRAGKLSTKVSQIVLEPISAEPFVLRAESTMTTRAGLSRRDLEQALSLEPGNARAHWLYSRVLSGMEEHKKSIKAAKEANRLEPGNAQYRVTYAQALAQTGQLPQAIEEAQKAMAASEDRPHVKARAMCLIGDLLASGPRPDFKKALSLHTEAIQVADPLSSDPHPAIRLAAKEVLIDAHLSAAHDIAWGEWKDKPKAVARWLDRAVATAMDIVTTEGGTEEQLFRVYARSLSAYVGVRGEIDPTPTAKSVVATGEKLIAATRDPGHKAQLQWELGMALYDALQICQVRSESEAALKHGELASQYLTAAIDAKPGQAPTYLLGRLYFRMGLIYSMTDENHKGAIDWFEKAIPLMERASPNDVAVDVGRQGEAFVTMGVSYWKTGRRDKAVALTQKGINWMEQAAKQGSLDRSSLAQPYGNLAAMHRTLGAEDAANRYQEMASRIKGDKLK